MVMRLDELARIVRAFEQVGELADGASRHTTTAGFFPRSLRVEKRNVVAFDSQTGGQVSSSGSRAHNSYLGRKITHGKDESSGASLRLSSILSGRMRKPVCHEDSKTPGRTKLRATPSLGVLGRPADFKPHSISPVRDSTLLQSRPCPRLVLADGTRPRPSARPCPSTRRRCWEQA